MSEAVGSTREGLEPAITGLSQEDYNNLVRDAMKWRHAQLHPDEQRRISPDSLLALRSAMKLTIEEAMNALDYAREGRKNTVKPDLLANQINRLIVRRLEALVAVAEKLGDPK